MRLNLPHQLQRYVGKFWIECRSAAMNFVNAIEDIIQGSGFEQISTLAFLPIRSPHNGSAIKPVCHRLRLETRLASRKAAVTTATVAHIYRMSHGEARPNRAGWKSIHAAPSTVSLVCKVKKRRA